MSFIPSKRDKDSLIVGDRIKIKSRGYCNEYTITLIKNLYSNYTITKIIEYTDKFGNNYTIIPNSKVKITRL